MKSVTPEHAKRGNSHRDVLAAYSYVDTIKDTADIYVGGASPAWHGWALREAFLAGISYAQEQPDDKTQTD